MACERVSIVETMGFDEILSESVRKYPALYDKTNPSFKDRVKKNSAWENVAEELNVEGGGTVVEKLFCNLRKRYNKEKAKIKKLLKSGGATTGSEAMIGELKLQFLQWIEPFLKPRKSLSCYINSTAELSEGNHPLEYDEDDEEECSVEQDDDITEVQNCNRELDNKQEIEVVVPESMYQDSSEIVTKECSTSTMPGRENHVKRKRKRAVDSRVELRRSFTNSVSNPQLVDSSNNKDECDHFATFVASQLRTLSRMNRLIVQNSIQNTIFHAMIEEQRSSEGNSISTSSPSCMLCYPNSRKSVQSNASLPDTGHQHGTFSDVSVNSSSIEHHLQ